MATSRSSLLSGRSFEVGVNQPNAIIYFTSPYSVSTQLASSVFLEQLRMLLPARSSYAQVQ